VKCLLITGFLGVNLSVQAQEASTWSGPDTSDGFDWIELTSGEWLRGELKALYDDKLEFDSDKLDLLNLDWEDVSRVVAERIHTVRSEDKREISGALSIDEEEVRVTGLDGETNVFDRVHLLSVVEGAPKEINYWSSKISAGLTLQRGNTDQSDANISARIQRRTAANRFNLDYQGFVTTIDDVETANNHRVNSNFDIFMSRRLFLRPVFGQYYRDPFKNIDHRGTVAVGVGYHIIDTSRTEWDVFGGPGYQYTKFASVLSGERSAAHAPAFVAGTDYDTELTSWMDVFASFGFILVNRDSGTYLHEATAGVSFDLPGDILDLDLSVIWDHIATPQPREDGSIPQPDDLRFMLGLGLDF